MVNLGRLLVAFSLILCVTELSAQQIDTTFWVPNGPVNAVQLHDSTVIVGGDFDMVSPVTGAFVRLDSASAAVDPALFKVNGAVYATERDSAGYIYVGGNFSRVGSTPVSNLFRMKPDGTFDHSFMHSVLGTVYALEIHDTDLFIGGEFTSIDGESRNNFGGISLNLDLVNICDPNVNGPVYCIEMDEGGVQVIIGGDFTQVRSFNAPYITKIGSATGSPIAFGPTPWNAVPNANGPVYDIVREQYRLYIAGEFTHFANIPRVGIAILLDNGLLQPYDAQVNGPVYEIELSDSSFYVGGAFTSFGGQTRNNFARIDRDLNLFVWWDPGVDGTVRTITQLDKERMFVGGSFSVVAGDSCRNAAVIIKSTASAADWDPVFNHGVYTAICDSSNNLYVGGEFFGVGGVPRKNLCAFSINTGVATAWHPIVNDEVRILTLDGDTLYFAGNFTNVNATARGRIAAIDLTGDSLLSFNPGTNGIIQTIAVTPTEVYLGGTFSSVGGQPRNNIGKVSKSNSLATPWNPNSYGTVNEILIDDYWIYVAGFFNTIAGVPRENLARLDPTSAVADPAWVCNVDDGIYEAQFYNGALGIGGWFTTVDGQPSPYFAIVNIATLALTPLNFNCDGFVRTFATYGDDFFITGNFTLVNSVFQPGLIAYDEGNAAVDPWTPGPDIFAKSMQANITQLFVGGTLMYTFGGYHPYLQVMNIQWVTGIEETLLAESSFSVYPVPASDFITIESRKNFASYTITDLTGKIVLAGELPTGSTQQTISVADLSTGMYILNLAAADGESSSQKIVVD